MKEKFPRDKVAFAIHTVCKQCDNRNCLLSKLGKTRSVIGIMVFFNRNAEQVFLKFLSCHSARHSVDQLSGDQYYI